MLKKIGVFILVIFLLSIAYFYYFTSIEKRIMDKELDIVKGDRINTVIEKLELENKYLIMLYLKTSGRWNKILPGSYSFKGKFTIADIFNIIMSGKVNKVKIVIPEGWTLKAVEKELVNKEIIKPNALTNVLKSGIDFYYPHPNNNYEGYFYPATYLFSKNQNVKDVAKTILLKFLEEFPPDKYPDTEDFYQKLIMASIIEKEVYFAEEKKIVASVFYNRLNKGIRLESCATVEYLYNYSKDRLLYEDLKIESPFNTYKNKGLPPAPISNPSKSSIEAAFFPAKTEYLFFVARENRKHIFSKTYKQHINAQKIGESTYKK